MNTNNIGKNIAELRKNKGITQETLAEAAGVSPQAVSKWESGGTPDIELMPSIADYFGVSIDKLFGRNVKEFGSLEEEVAKYITGEPGYSAELQTERFKRAFEICWVIERAFFNNDFVKNPDMQLERILEMDKHNIYSQNLSDHGIINMTFSQNNKYFMMVPEPEDGFKTMIGNTEDFINIFKAFGDEKFFQALCFLYSRENKAFTPKLLVKRLDVTLEKAVDIIKILIEYGLVSSAEVELDDEDTQIYSFNPNPAFIGLLLMCREIINRPGYFYCYNGGRGKPYLK